MLREEGICPPCTGYSSNINNDNEQRADQGPGPTTSIPLIRITPVTLCHTHTYMHSSECGHEHEHMTVCTYMHTQMYSSQQRHIIQKMDNVSARKHTHTQMGQTCKWTPTGTEKKIPLWPESPYSPSPLPSHTLLTYVTHNQPPSPTHIHFKSPCLFPTHHITPLHTLSVSLPCIYTHTHALRHGGCPASPLDPVGH